MVPSVRTGYDAATRDRWRSRSGHAPGRRSNPGTVPGHRRNSMRRTRITTLATIVAATSLAVGGAVSAQSPDASTAATTWKVGVVTDIGTLNDKNFNEYTFKGAQQGAKDIGAPEPQSIVPTAAADYGP